MCKLNDGNKLRVLLKIRVNAKVTTNVNAEICQTYKEYLEENNILTLYIIHNIQAKSLLGDHKYIQS